ncbi:MAG TPA: hypothetical protein VGC79_06465 [Polyangiaceae bacterium]
MNLDDDEDSVFEQALRADLPTLAQQNRLRQRILAASIVAGTVAGTTNVAAATQASLSASALSKLSALSWPAKLGLTAVLAAPLAGVALPVVYAPVRGAAIVSQVRSSAASVRARSAAKALSASNLLPLSPPVAPQTSESERESARQPVPQASAVNGAARASLVLPSAVAPALALGPAATGNAASAAPSVAGLASVAAFDSAAHEVPAGGSERQRNASTLAAETQLLERAFAALAAGDRATAAALVSEHARLFPNGLLRQERERARARLATDSKGE